IDGGFSVDLIAAITWIPLEGVIPVAAEDRVTPLLAIDEIIARSAGKDIGKVAAKEGIVSSSAENLHHSGIAGHGEQVVAGAEIGNDDTRDSRNGLFSRGARIKIEIAHE